MSADDLTPADDDLMIGTAVEPLIEAGDEQAAALLDVISYRVAYYPDPYSEVSAATLVLCVPIGCTSVHR